MRKALAAMFVLALLAAVPALAGDGHKKCTGDTQDCLNKMASKMKTTGWIGVELEKVEETGAILVKQVVAGSPAEKSGLKPGDVLYAINGIALNEENEEKIWKDKEAWKPGKTISYTIKRDGYDRKASLTLAPMPADLLAKYIGQHMLEHATVEVASN